MSLTYLKFMLSFSYLIYYIILYAIILFSFLLLKNLIDFQRVNFSFSLASIKFIFNVHQSKVLFFFFRHNSGSYQKLSSRVFRELNLSVFINPSFRNSRLWLNNILLYMHLWSSKNGFYINCTTSDHKAFSDFACKKYPLVMNLKGLRSCKFISGVCRFKW